MGSKDTNFSLNHEELSLLSDQSFFVRKKLVTGRIIDLFGTLESEFDAICQKYKNNLPPDLLRRRGKISRGENYKGLPYVILDYPALFEKNGVFAFRTLMWWGHPFSFTFHLAGTHLDKYLDALFPAIKNFDTDTMICINSGQWEHHHETSNYIPISQFLNSPQNNKDYFMEKGFLKLSKTVSLDMHPQIPGIGTDFLEGILNKLQ